MLTPKTRDQLSKAAGFIRESTSRGLGDGDLLRGPPVPSATHSLARREAYRLAQDSTTASSEHPDRAFRVEGLGYPKPFTLNPKPLSVSSARKAASQKMPGRRNWVRCASAARA